MNELTKVNTAVEDFCKKIKPMNSVIAAYLGSQGPETDFSLFLRNYVVRAPKSRKRLETLAEVQTLFEQEDVYRLTSFLRAETRPALYALHLARKEEVKEAAKLAAELMMAGVSFPDVYKAIRKMAEAISWLGSVYTLKPQIADTLPIECMHHILWLAMRWVKTQEKASLRNVELADTTLRDMPQSEHGRVLPLDLSVQYFEQVLRDPGHPMVFETGGGAYPQMGLLESRMGKHVHCPFEIHERLLRAHLGVFSEVWGGGEFPAELLVRFTPGPDRVILPDDEVVNLMKRVRKDPESEQGKRLRRLYQVRQSMLTRGRFGVVLEEVSEELLTALLTQFRESGVDTARVFDYRNEEEDILFGCRAAAKAGLEIEPVLHPDPNFAGGLDEYRKIVTNILAGLSHRKIFAWSVKSAPGTVGAAQSYEIGRMLDEVLPAGMAVRYHTHDTGGEATFAYVSMASAITSGRRFLVDGCLGNAQRAQPDLRTLSRVFSGAGWLAKGCDLQLLKTQSRFWTAYTDKLRSEGVVSESLTARARFEVFEAGLAGGASETMRSDFRMMVPEICKAFGLDPDADLSKVLEALVQSVIELLPEVDRLYGYICKVTPAMNWLIKQTLDIRMAQLRARGLDWRENKLVPKGGFPPSLWKDQLHPELKNHLWRVLQDERIKARFPADDELLMVARQSLLEEFVGLCNLLPAWEVDFADSWNALVELAGMLERPCVDAFTLSAVKHLHGRWKEVSYGSAEALVEELVSSEKRFDRSLVLETLDQVKARKLVEGMSWKEFLIVSCFGVHGEHFMKAKRHWLDQQESQEARSALAAMGVH